jgi:hypothetical protein
VVEGVNRNSVRIARMPKVIFFVVIRKLYH